MNPKYKAVVVIGPAKMTFRGRFDSMKDALAYYSQKGRVIELKELNAKV